MTDRADARSSLPFSGQRRGPADFDPLLDRDDYGGGVIGGVWGDSSSGGGGGGGAAPFLLYSALLVATSAVPFGVVPGRVLQFAYAVGLVGLVAVLLVELVRSFAATFGLNHRLSRYERVPDVPPDLPVAEPVGDGGVGISDAVGAAAPTATETAMARAIPLAEPFFAIVVEGEEALPLASVAESPVHAVVMVVSDP